MPRQHAPDALRPIEIRNRYLESVPGSVLYSSGKTRVLCVASIVEGVPAWRESSGKGWATAEYSLLPGSTRPRAQRERGKISGRTQEIQRLIGRSLRGVLDYSKLADHTLQIDCDVLQADGGTRTASINGAYLAAELAVRDALREGRLEENPISGALGAVSVGIVDRIALLDLDYEEDASAEVDLNVVQVDDGRFLEIQGTAEGVPFARDDLSLMLDLATAGIREIHEVCRRNLATAG